MNQVLFGNIPAEAVGSLREALSRFMRSDLYNKIVEPKEAVLARFQPAFAPERVGDIAEDEFLSFLLFKHNHHWTGLHRTGPRMCSDMGRLREALGLLVDETRPVADRLDDAVRMVSGMGKNVASAILLITQPDRYGVWNNRSEAVMKQLRIWPEFERGESFGRRYVKVNQILLHLRDSLQIDLWTLDALLWYMEQGEPEREENDEDEVPLCVDAAADNGQRFGLERHLQEFLRDNWRQTELGQEWAIYGEQGDEEAGYEYPCSIGRIDLLAKHKSEPRWLVLELKRNQTSDETVGQLLRYIGWVKSHLAEDGETVQGLIICREADDKIRYALSTLDNIDLRLYRVEFHLEKPAPLRNG